MRPANIHDRPRPERRMPLLTALLIVAGIALMAGGAWVCFLVFG